MCAYVFYVYACVCTKITGSSAKSEHGHAGMLRCSVSGLLQGWRICVVYILCVSQVVLTPTQQKTGSSILFKCSLAIATQIQQTVLHARTHMCSRMHAQTYMHAQHHPQTTHTHTHTPVHGAVVVNLWGRMSLGVRNQNRPSRCLQVPPRVRVRVRVKG